MLKIAKVLLFCVCFAFADAGGASKFIPPDARATLVPPDTAGNQLYTIWLRKDLVEALGSFGEAKPRDLHDPVNSVDFRGWHRQPVRKMARLIERDYAIDVIGMTSWAFPTITAYLSREAISAMDADDRIDRVYAVTQESFSAAPPWSDILATEYTSYGKIAMDMNDSLGTTTRVYMADAGINPVNLAHVDLSGSVVQAPIGSFCDIAAGHAMHVAGILAASHNGQAVKGMNNAAPVTSVNKGCGGVGNTSQITDAFDWIVAETEAAGTYNVINISANDYVYADGGGVDKFMRKASARNLVVQSAGNFNENACNRAFGPTSDRDGILVVGAINNQGSRAINYDNSMAGYVSGQSSSWGSCVEVWAPGANIWSTWTGGTTARMLLSGTSMAAPHVAAMAARLTPTTHPVIREAYVRSKLFTTGFTDDHGYTIKVPSYTKTPTFTLPTKLTATALSVSSTYSTNTASKATDGNYLTTTWNSGVTPVYPSVQPYFQMDFGVSKTLWSVRLTPSQTPSGMSTHEIYVGNTTPPTTLAATITRDVFDGEVVSASLAGYAARYVRVVTRASPSWASYYEVEVFGY